MNGELSLEAPVVRGVDARVPQQPVREERRRAERIRARLVFEVYDHCRYLGRFSTRDVSQEGLFLRSKAGEVLEHAILSLRFRSGGVERQLRGLAVHRVPGEGVGIQLAFWRPSDHEDHRAYRRLIGTGSPDPQPTP